jgi:hypothetical protein
MTCKLHASSLRYLDLGETFEGNIHCLFVPVVFQSTLEFSLRQQEFVELVRANARLEAVK